MNIPIKLVVVTLAMVFFFGVMDLSAAESSENKAKETGKEIWETLKKDLKEVKDTATKQGKKAGEGAKRNVKEAKETVAPDKKKTEPLKKDKPQKTDP